ncbi:hypothetical protein FHX76_002249 [Lysinibacter cavernae]|uniref:Uncharacterized protein n=1 Tax=Lysinibacter cavernae TaxID=1640652 RepID=A0A7X5TUG5_9MICO|nr:hypothetical protein [Lysinibacter cavernae]
MAQWPIGFAELGCVVSPKCHTIIWRVSDLKEPSVRPVVTPNP